MRTNQIASRWPAFLLGAITLLALAGCGGSQSSPSGAATPTPAAVATMPPARFTAVAQQSAVTQTVALTASIAPVTAAVTAAVTSTVTSTQTSTAATTSQTDGQASAASAADLERGARSYERNQCASCHGEQGEGVTGRGGAIADTPLSEREFENVLRTGGGLGNTHIFGPSAISPAGMGVLYAYVQSLQ